jgi:2-polyprenyl-3-methyl-5-hydroxy-6-metoxy-1,4-benzoquinol methylase
MLSKAKQKINSSKVLFQYADITLPWSFTTKKFDLICFSLVLEHIENLDFIFNEISKVLLPQGHVYIGELHPYKQYTGTKARFETTKGQQVLTCFTHHVSDFINTAKKHGLILVDVNEYFDENDKSITPRIISLVLQKNA